MIVPVKRDFLGWFACCFKKVKPGNLEEVVVSNLVLPTMPLLQGGDQSALPKHLPKPNRHVFRLRPNQKENVNIPLFTIFGLLMHVVFYSTSTQGTFQDHSTKWVNRFLILLFVGGCGIFMVYQDAVHRKKEENLSAFFLCQWWHIGVIVFFCLQYVTFTAAYFEKEIGRAHV